MSLDLREVGFEQALNALGAAGRTFHRVVDAKVLSVMPDTPAKRRDFEQQVVKTIFLSNADLKETIDLLRVVLGARRVAPVPGINALTINDTPDKVAAAERIVDMVDKRRAEVVVEVEILEVDRNRLKEYGVYLTSGLDASGHRGHRRRASSRTRCITSPDHGPVRPRQPGRQLAARRRRAAARDRLLDAPAGQPAAAHLRGPDGAGPLRRPGARAGDDLHADRQRRRRAAADHVLRVQERRRQHRHQAARAPRRRRHARAQARHLVGGRAGLPGPADLQQPHGRTRPSACATARPTCSPA